MAPTLILVVLMICGIIGICLHANPRPIHVSLWLFIIVTVGSIVLLFNSRMPFLGS